MLTRTSRLTFAAALLSALVLTARPAAANDGADLNDSGAQDYGLDATGNGGINIDPNNYYGNQIDDSLDNNGQGVPANRDSDDPFLNGVVDLIQHFPDSPADPGSDDALLNDLDATPNGGMDIDPNNYYSNQIDDAFYDSLDQ